jgi:putative AbiEii toxin of type IV toxin-antitoxin system
VTIGEALDLLGSREPRIEVVGVTDYCSTRLFRQARAAMANGHGRGIAMLFPNVELRLTQQTSRGSGVNLHLLCAPDQVDRLDGFLGKLSFSFLNDTYPCSAQGLIDLGSAMAGATHGSDDLYHRSGAQQFKVELGDLQKAYRNSSWAREHCVVALAAGENDGSSGIGRTDGGFAAVRQSLEHFAHAVFSGNPQDAQYWLGLGADDQETLARGKGGLKPCLHGSDAHKPAELGQPRLDRYCWVKGEPAFESLQMACYAPASRVVIGSESPALAQEHDRIAELTVSNPESFVADVVPINAGLVAVIGARGSGKTALADLIAVAAGSDDPFNDGRSFVSRARPLLEDTTVMVRWLDGAMEPRSIGDGPSRDPWSETRVRYLNQQFVERLCEDRGVSDRLLEEIERVVFESWAVVDRAGQRTFRDLLDLRLRASRETQRTKLERVRQLSDEIVDERALSRTVESKIRQRGVLAAEVARREKAVEQITSTVKVGDRDRIAAVKRVHDRRVQQVSALQSRKAKIATLRAAVDSTRTVEFPRLTSFLRDAGRDAGIPDEMWEHFTVRFAGDVDRAVNDAIDGLNADLVRLDGVRAAEEEPPPRDGLDELGLGDLTLRDLEFEIERLQRLLGLDKARDEALTQLERKLSEARGSLATLDDQVTDAQGAAARAAAKVDERRGHYADYFDALLQEDGELRAMYEPLQALVAAGPAGSKLTFVVQRVVDVARWAEPTERDLLDLRTGEFQGRGELARRAELEIGPAWRSGDGMAAAAAVEEFSRKYSNKLREQRRVDYRADEASLRKWDQAVSRWLYSTEHITLKYSLNYEGLGIERLSPGTRGIVLLLLYLAVDQAETMPMIIDQPEENLDPQSIFSHLVGLFRSASERRQIIMITHNANLVVNTDVDQVIVASCGEVKEGQLPSITYTSGGLEQAHIRRLVCQVLEGGEEAFRERARRLGLHWAPAIEDA